MKTELCLESADFHVKYLSELEDHFTAVDVLLSENVLILNVKDLQVI